MTHTDLTQYVFILIAFIALFVQSLTMSRVLTIVSNLQTELRMKADRRQLSKRPVKKVDAESLDTVELSEEEVPWN